MHKERNKVTHEAWVKIFLDTYNFSKKLAVRYFTNEVNDNDLKICLENIRITATENGLDLMARIVNKSFIALDDKASIEDVIFPFCIEMWSYLSLISLLDFDKNGDLKNAEKAFNHFQEEDFTLDETGNIGKTIFVSFLSRSSLWKLVG